MGTVRLNMSLMKVPLNEIPTMVPFFWVPRSAEPHGHCTPEHVSDESTTE